MPKQELNAVVSQKIELTPELFILQVVPEGWELSEFQLGQIHVEPCW